MKRRLVFLSGTRADFGKIRSLIDVISKNDTFEVHVFVTGMHLLKRYGLTYREIEKRGYQNIYKYINQNYDDDMDSVLAKTISGFSDYVKEIEPDMIVVHGDRVEAMAGAIVGSLNNILVSHVEGGEVSGTIDDLLRHSISKLSHLHFVTNERAKMRLHQMGENPESIFSIGSPDVDVLFSDSLPPISKVKSRYDIPYGSYAIVLFHPVTTEQEYLEQQVDVLIDTMMNSGDNYVVIYPNNDSGSDVIISAYEKRLRGDERIRIFPSMRFEYFLTLMKHCNYMLGNSSSALMEAPYYGIPSINIGTRQNNRCSGSTIHNCGFDRSEVLSLVKDVKRNKYEPAGYFGETGSADRFMKIVDRDSLWKTHKQKIFLDIQ